MNEKDHLTLAAIIKQGREHYDASPTNERRSTEAIEALEFVAREFAEHANVDEFAFLAACGM